MYHLLSKLFQKALPPVWDVLTYFYLAPKKGFRTANCEQVRLAQELAAHSEGKSCLQIGYRGKKIKPHWICVDLFDQSDQVDFHYDVHNLEFPDEAFDLVVCNAVLEHIEDPAKAIRELGRVLKPGGEIYVEVPFNQPYHPDPGDFWRVTLPGLRLWMKDFEEISANFFGRKLYNAVYFYGRKVK